MAKGFKHGAGGGTSLNFKVVGNPQPASPKENTIWVNTDTPISGYHFGNEEPLVSDGNELILATQYDGVYGTIDGSLVEDPNYTTKIFAIPTGTRKVCVRVDNYIASNAAHTFFDKDSVPVSSFLRQAGYSFVDVPDNAAYVVLAVRNSETASVTGANPEEGMVWIPTGTSSTVPFNALKKNGITVYPLSTKQYVNGAWVERVAKSYQNGAWVDWWNGELYDNGNEYDFITGSWIPYKTSFPDLTAVEPKVTRNPSSIKIKISQDGGYGGALVTKNKVSFKGKKSLVFTGSSSGEGNSRCCIRIWSQMATNFDTYKVAEYSFPSGGISDSTVRLDVNSLDGEYYVGLCIVSVHWIEMKSMKLE